MPTQVNPTNNPTDFESTSYEGQPFQARLMGDGNSPCFEYQRQVRLSDTDAAGVVYFANGLQICHEAYEAFLTAAGVDLRSFFSGQTMAVPVVKAEIGFRRPLYVGDALVVQLALRPQPNPAAKLELAPEPRPKLEAEAQPKLEPEHWPNSSEPFGVADPRAHLGKDASEFTIDYQIHGPLGLSATATTRHVCINPTTRSRQLLPDVLRQWQKSIEGRMG
jgi:1,4-dihydroxy-2-naphthoyl-CoA hydrolase